MRKKHLGSKLLSRKVFSFKSWFSRYLFKRSWLKTLAAIAIFFPLAITNKLPTYGELLPASEIHPLPASLIGWQDPNNLGDYFDSIETTPVGYLIWSEFPITVYFEQSQTEQDPTNPTAKAIRILQWEEAVREAIAEWSHYLPLQIVTSPKSADIFMERSTVARTAKLNPKTGLYDIPRTITAQTSYEFYLRGESGIKNKGLESKPKVLAHKMFVKISSDLSAIATLSAARHELGHALGIWGHSDLESDALYFSQVRSAPSISPRDINTLKKIYQQPSKLGWKILQPEKS